MKRILSSAILLLFFCISTFSQWHVNGGSHLPYVYQPSLSSGLETVYLLYGSADLSLSFTASNETSLVCRRYANRAAESEVIPTTQTGNTFVINNPQPGYGYFIEQGGRSSDFIWILDYAQYPLEMKGLAVDGEVSDCERVRLIFDRSAPDLSFFTINGGIEKIERAFSLSYQTLKWNEEKKDFENEDVEDQVKGSREITVTAPLCNTRFLLSGDQFLRFWGSSESVQSSEFETSAVRGMAAAEQIFREAGNEIDKESDVLGGSAPVEIRFTGYANTPVATYQAWELSRNPEFSEIDATYTDPVLEYTFENGGDSYVRYVISNAQNSCEQVVETFTVHVSESALQVPNVFTPDSESGDNRLFKVAYRSILKFEGWIFNRWGNQLFHWTDPAEGWDGTYHGKLVPTGAYYYVIKAEGVGGEKLNRKGDINVLRTRNVQ